jgi:hypothetical protein
MNHLFVGGYFHAQPVLRRLARPRVMHRLWMAALSSVCRGASKRSQLRGLGVGTRVSGCGVRSPDQVGKQWFLDEVTKIAFVVVPAVSAQPRSALVQQIGC